MKSDKTHIMVDIETLDTEPTAVILSIGGCKIHEPDITFYSELDISTQFERTRSESTVTWWQAQEAQGVYMPNGNTYIETALAELSDWILKVSEGRESVIWCKGTDFDVKILANAYAQFKRVTPWKYNRVRDLRTLIKLHPQIQHPENLVPHHALQDALHQTRQLHAIFQYNDRLQWE